MRGEVAAKIRYARFRRGTACSNARARELRAFEAAGEARSSGVTWARNLAWRRDDFPFARVQVDSTQTCFCLRIRRSAPTQRAAEENANLRLSRVSLPCAGVARSRRRRRRL